MKVSVDPTIVPDRYNVFASYSQSSPLDTGVDLYAGELLSIAVPRTELWSGGNSGTSNANGLPRTYTYESFTFPIGSLVGRIGDSSYFLVGTDFRQIVQASGDLSLLYWDSSYGDNHRSVMATVCASSVPMPPAFILFATGLFGLLGLKRRRATYEGFRA